MGTHERLEVEGEDERQKRLGHLLMRVDQAGETPPTVFKPSVTLPTDQVAGGSITSPIVPPIEQLSVLDRVRQFLPQLAESNVSLSERDQRELDIENISDGDAYIEMNLGLGVFEYGRRGDSDDLSSASASSSSMSEHDSGESDSSSSGSSTCSEDDAQVAARPKKPLPRRAKQGVTVQNKLGNPPNGPSA